MHILYNADGVGVGGGLRFCYTVLYMVGGGSFDFCYITLLKFVTCHFSTYNLTFKNFTAVFLFFKLLRY